MERIHILLCKIATIILVGVLVAFILFEHSEDLYPSSWGSYALGGDFYALDNEGRGLLVVYCADSNLHKRTCYGGLNLLQYPNWECMEVRYNETYIAMIVRDRNKDQLKYYIFDKRCIEGKSEDSVSYDVLQQGMTLLSDIAQYEEECDKLKIINHL